MKEEMAAPVMSKPMEEETGKKMLKQAMKICGIDKQEHILSWRYFTPQEQGGERIVLVTNGGEKVSYIASEQKAYVGGVPLTDPLDPVRIDGISRKKSRNVAGIGKK